MDVLALAALSQSFEHLICTLALRLDARFFHSVVQRMIAGIFRNFRAALICADRRSWRSLIRSNESIAVRSFEFDPL